MLMVNSVSVDVDLPPRPVFANRGQPTKNANCATVKRVMRGSNFARYVPKETPKPKPSALWQRKMEEARQRLLEKIRKAADRSDVVHAEVQCQLESIEEMPEEAVLATQDDGEQTELTPGYLLNKTPYLRTDTGVDVCTQVTEYVLADFDAEAYPLMVMLTASALETAAVCVLREDDAAVLCRERAVNHSKRLAERVETVRLELVGAERRRRKLRELADAERASPESAYRAIHSRVLAEHYNARLVADVFDQLTTAGYTTVDKQRFPRWVLAGFRNHCRRRERADAPMDDLIEHAIADRTQLHQDDVFGHTRPDCCYAYDFYSRVSLHPRQKGISIRCIVFFFFKRLQRRG